MRSRARIGNHPIHPMIVPIPIGAFFLSFLGDLLYVGRANLADRFWYEFSYVCMAVGIAFALAAAAVGAIDYLGVKMSAKAFRIATRHALLALSLVAFYVTSFFLRSGQAAEGGGRRWAIAFALSFLAFLMLGAAGWFGAQVAFEHRVGVLEEKELLDETIADPLERRGTAAEAQRT